jgi:hypothetical protein
MRIPFGFEYSLAQVCGRMLTAAGKMKVDRLRAAAPVFIRCRRPRSTAFRQGIGKSHWRIG